MTDKEFLYTIYDSDLVDRAIDQSKDFYREHEADMLFKMATTADMLPDRTGGSEIYDKVQQQMVFSYLHGASYAVEHELTSTAPSEVSFSDFHKAVDFAVLFDFGDNDFGFDIETGAKAFCEEFNSKLRQIDMYDDHEWSRNNYINEFNELIKPENIKEIMKCGFMASLMRRSSEVICGRMPNAIEALESLKSHLDYIRWDDDRTKWEKVGEEYVESEPFPRFVTGTNAEIAETLKAHGTPDKVPSREFPVWCNGEVVILYMKNGYLTYTTR